MERIRGMKYIQYVTSSKDRHKAKGRVDKILELIESEFLKHGIDPEDLHHGNYLVTSRSFKVLDYGHFYLNAS